MRRAAAIAGICILITGCASTSSAESAKPTRTMIPRPLVERELGDVLLSPEETAATMGVPAMTVTESQTAMTDNSAIMEPIECLAIDGAAELQVYANSGYRAERDQSLNDGAVGGGTWNTYVKQAVVLFPYLEKAGEFFEASVQQWPACREYTHTQSGSRWSPGPIVREDNRLSTVAMQQDAAAPGWGCGRALVHRNNVIVDVNTCSAAPGDSALRIADQIAAKVDAQW
ncbi:sensor domain-containing protein [Mycolicibacterium sp. BiH015]|uniref:sensor domain-containing protein n=1 Tax=Mycolicibacterium sp. BiH015 TaxID=3018808 RepID=UPI0022E427AE|nr:sensor domain-containing protein [Mycolicibacterium sp. BiH015]MDA2892929.1 sensor domain-containing protein [Mycolicibacterium sp. BiH015]